MSAAVRRRVTIVGAGGLGGPIALALGHDWTELTLCDPDVVELSNLHRQIAFTVADLGQSKAEALARAVEACGGVARGHALRFDATTAAALIAGTELLIDGSDDPATKFLVADVAVAAGIPYVIASAVGLGGNVFVGGPGTACYRCLFEDAPDEAPTCADAGVLGPLVAWLGGEAASRAAALLADPEDAGWIAIVDGVGGAARRVDLARRPGCACEGRG